MKLISCYISGFGRIIDQEYIFTNGLNSILQENGSGKTTFCAFIKAMFYGMEDSRKRKELTERERFRPWSGAPYGGNLTFSLQDKMYKIERTFGNKGKDDTFRLIDMSTLKDSEDFTENVGQEIFAVDKESFEKSIFIPENALKTSMTDSFNARLGGSREMTGEGMTRFDEAVDRVDAAIRDYTRKSKTNTGRLILLQEEIRTQQEQVDKIPVLQDAIRKLEDLIWEKRRVRYNLEREKKKLAKQALELSAREQARGAYYEKKQQLSAQQEQLTGLEVFFTNGLPAAAEIEAVTETEHELSVQEKELAKISEKIPKAAYVADLEEMFKGGETLPSEGELSHWEKAADHIKELRIKRDYTKLSEDDRQQLAELGTYFSKKKPTGEELELISKELTNQAKIDGQAAEAKKAAGDLQIQKNAQEKFAPRDGRADRMLLSLALGIVLILGGGVFLYYILVTDAASWLPPVTLMLIGGIVITLGVRGYIIRRSRIKKELEELQKKWEEAEKKAEAYEKLQKASADIIDEFLQNFLVNPTDSKQQMLTAITLKWNTYQRLLEQQEKALGTSDNAVEELAAASMELYTQLDPYARQYGIDLYNTEVEEDVTVIVARLREDAQTYRTYRQECARQEVYQKQVEEMRRKVYDFLSKYPVKPETTRHEQLSEIRTNLDRYGVVFGRVEQLTEDVHAYEEKEQVTEDALSMEELQKIQAENEAELESITQLLNDEREELNDRLEELETYEEAAEKVEELKEQEKEMREKVSLLEDTKSYLQKARENFLSRYMTPLQNRMKNYLGMLTQDIPANAGQMAQALASPAKAANGADAANRTEAGQRMKNPVERIELSLDMDLNPKVIVQGSIKDGDFLSAGYQDLAALCSRFALIDVLYPGEKPPVILDDPFSNLDANKMKRALELLKKDAKDRQILYLTCHESRMP